MTTEPIFVPPGARPQGQPRENGGRPVLVQASARQRAAARVIDAAAALLALMGANLLLVSAVLGRAVSFEVMALSTLAAMLAAMALYLFLRVARLVLWGCTVGQRIAGVRVVRLDDHLRFPGWRHAYRRLLPTWGSHFSPGTGPWSDLLAFRRDERTRRCLHDRTAGTVVIRAAEAEPVRRALLAATLPAAALAIVLGILLVT